MKKRTVKSFGWVVMFALLVFLVAASTSWAEKPARDTCENESVGGCVDEVLLEFGDEKGENGMIDDAEAIIEDADAIIDDLEAMGLFSLGGDNTGLDVRITEMPEDILERIRNIRLEHGRAHENNDANTDDDYDDMLGQADQVKGRKNCNDSDMTFYDSLEDDGSGGKLPPPGYTWADMSNNPEHGPPNLLGNGKCDVFAAEYEYVDEGGNTVTVDVTVNERSENMCEPLCKGKAGQQGKSKGRFVGGMQDVIISAGIARRNLSLQRVQMAALRAQISELRLSGADFSSLVDDVCNESSVDRSGALDAIHGLNIAIVSLDGVLLVGNALTAVLETITEIADALSNQDAFGFNASATYAVLVTVENIAKGVLGAIAGVKDILGSSKDIVDSKMEIDKNDEHDYTVDCRKEIRDKTDILQEDVTALQSATTALQGSADQTSADLAIIKDELTRIKDLLLTPAGKRDGFPSK